MSADASTKGQPHRASDRRPDHAEEERWLRRFTHERGDAVAPLTGKKATTAGAVRLLIHEAMRAAGQPTATERIYVTHVCPANGVYLDVTDESTLDLQEARVRLGKVALDRQVDDFMLDGNGNPTPNPFAGERRG